MIPAPKEAPLCPEAVEHAKRAEVLYRRGASAKIDGGVHVAEQLYRQGRNAMDKAYRSQAEHLEAEARRAAKEAAA